MKQKKSNKTLLILLLVVVVLIGALELFERYGGATIRKNLTDVNVSKITRIALSNECVDQYLSLRKEDSGWFITAEKVQIPIDDSSMEEILQLFKNMPPIKVVSDKQEDWETYETLDELGLRITAYRHKEILSDFFIGKVEYDASGEAVTYVRVQGDDEIYSVKGNIRKIFIQDFFEQVFPITQEEITL